MDIREVIELILRDEQESKNYKLRAIKILLRDWEAPPPLSRRARLAAIRNRGGDQSLLTPYIMCHGDEGERKE